MDMQSQMTRPYGHDQAEDPIRVHHPEEEEHQEKGATKVLKKVKEKAKKIKNSLTKHGHGHDHDHDVEIEDDENNEQDPQLHGAPAHTVYNTQGGVTGEPDSLRHPGEANVPAPEEIVPPGTQIFPVVSSDDIKPVEPEPLQDTLYRHEAASNLMDISDSGERRDAPSHPLGVFDDMSEREDRREAHQTPTNTSLLSITEDVTGTFAPGEDEYLGGGQGKVNVERPKGLEEDPAAGPGGRSSYLSGVSNYQSKVTDPTHEGGGEAGVPEIVESLGRMKVSPDEKRGFESDFPTRSHEFGMKNESETEIDTPARSDDVKVETGLGRDLPTGTHDQFSPELSPPTERHEEAHESKPSTYTEKIGLATSFVTDKAIAAKNAVASKLGYSEQHQSSTGDEATPRSATGYGQKVAGTVADKLTPVYEKVKETGSTVMTKLPLSGGGSGAEENNQVEDKGVLTRDYLAEKLRPGEEDKALAEVIAEKLHLGGGGEKKRTTTKEVEVTVEKIPTDQIVEKKEHNEADVAEEGKVGGGGMVGKLKGAVSSWLGGTTEEVKPKSSDSVDQSSQSLGTTVGTMGFSDSSGGALTGQRGFQDYGN